MIVDAHNLEKNSQRSRHTSKQQATTEVERSSNEMSNSSSSSSRRVLLAIVLICLCLSQCMTVRMRTSVILDRFKEQIIVESGLNITTRSIRSSKHSTTRPPVDKIKANATTILNADNTTADAPPIVSDQPAVNTPATSAPLPAANTTNVTPSQVTVVATGRWKSSSSKKKSSTSTTTTSVVANSIDSRLAEADPAMAHAESVINTPAKPTSSTPTGTTHSPGTAIAYTDRSMNTHIPSPSDMLQELRELVHTSNTSCPDPGLFSVKDTIILPAHTSRTAIPRQIHVASKTRCMTTPVAENIDRWRKFANHSLYIHDDDAVNRLFAQDWQHTFPKLHQAIQCLPRAGASSAAKADVWRYLILWHVGGLYTDLDNMPGPAFHGIIHDGDDAVVAIHNNKPGQSFLQMSPRHPLMYLALEIATERLLSLKNVAAQSAWKVTGPNVLDKAFQTFVGIKSTKKNSRLAPGVYYMSDQLITKYPLLLQHATNRSVTIVSGAHVRTSAGIRIEDKHEFYHLTGMSVWQDGPQEGSWWNASCASLLQSRGVLLRETQQQRGSDLDDSASKIVR